jgi:terminase small subunit / prophage DNA-packing protein
MKKSNDTVISAVTLARLLGLSAQAIANHASAGVLVRSGRGQYEKDASVTSYCAHLRKSASGRNTATSDDRARLARAKADEAERRNAVAEGKYLLASEVESGLSAENRRVQAGMLTVSSKVSVRLPYLTKDDINEIDLVVREVLTEIGEEK